MLKFDLRWHFGHYYYLLAIARRVGRARGMDEAAIRRMLDEMKAGDYCHLLGALEQWFPCTFEFSGDPRLPGTRCKQAAIDESVPVELEDLLRPDVFVAEMNAMNAAGLLQMPSRHCA